MATEVIVPESEATYPTETDVVLVYKAVIVPTDVGATVSVAVSVKVIFDTYVVEAVNVLLPGLGP